MRTGFAGTDPATTLVFCSKMRHSPRQTPPRPLASKPVNVFQLSQHNLGETSSRRNSRNFGTSQCFFGRRAVSLHNVGERGPGTSERDSSCPVRDSTRKPAHNRGRKPVLAAGFLRELRRDSGSPRKHCRNRGFVIRSSPSFPCRWSWGRCPSRGRFAAAGGRSPQTHGPGASASRWNLANVWELNLGPRRTIGVRRDGRRSPVLREAF